MMKPLNSFLVTETETDDIKLDICVYVMLESFIPMSDTFLADSVNMTLANTYATGLEIGIP